MGLQPSYLLFPGLRIVLESTKYQTSDEYWSGTITFATGAVKRFNLINGVCRPEEVTVLFNSSGVVSMIQQQLGSECQVEFNTDRCGFIN